MTSDVNIALWDAGWAIEERDKYYCPKCQHRPRARKTSAMPHQAFITLANIPVDANASLEEQVQEAFDWIRDNFSEVVFWRHAGELEEPLDVATYCQEWNSEEQELTTTTTTS
jgi:hypothetical protein